LLWPPMKATCSYTHTDTVKYLCTYKVIHNEIVVAPDQGHMLIYTHRHCGTLVHLQSQTW